ncbi:hypothetical protein SNE40_017457 [Patella caerulea]|uniref:Alpha-type protein kinase domain-containing protein n=1 Tax=Patella caerulea TaxID=87958 RepID=A0AAN8JH47_PATCE
MVLRLNHSTWQTNRDEDNDRYFANYDIKIFDLGEKMMCFRGRLNGRYLSSRNGEKVVVKTTRSLPGTEKRCDDVIRRCQVVQEYAREFSRFFNSKIRINIPLKCVNDELAWQQPFSKSRKLQKDEWMLIEKYYKDFKMFVNRKGDSIHRSELLEAFVHFIYVKSERQITVCNLQGTRSGDYYSISGPVVHSVQRQYGSTDGGELALKSVVRKHTCNTCCRLFLQNIPPLSHDVTIFTANHQLSSQRSPPDDGVHDDIPPPYDVAIRDDIPPSYDVAVRDDIPPSYAAVLHAQYNRYDFNPPSYYEFAAKRIRRNQSR